MVESSDAVDDADIVDHVVQAADAAYQTKLNMVEPGQFTRFERMVLLQIMDVRWREHLAALDYLRQGIHLRGYAQKQPKQEYKREAFELFGRMLDSVRDEVTRVLITVKIEQPQAVEQAAEALEVEAQNLKNIQYSGPDETGQAQVQAAHGLGQSVTSAAGVASSAVPKVGRNDPCPCGSGKKYKHCHGALT